MLRSLAIVVVLALVPMRADAHEPDPARRRGGYVHVAPVSVGTGFDTSFGVAADGGWHFRGARRFALQVGLRADHQRLLWDLHARQTYGGVQLRLGAVLDAAPTVFAYGTGSIGAVVSDTGFGEWIGPAGALGGGVQLLLRRHLVVGLEAGPQLGGEIWAQLRAHVFVGAWF